MKFESSQRSHILKSLLLKQAFCFCAAGKNCPVALRLPGLRTSRPGKAKPPPGNKPHYRLTRIGAVASTSHGRASLSTSGDSASRTCW